MKETSQANMSTDPYLELARFIQERSNEPEHESALSASENVAPSVSASTGLEIHIATPKDEPLPTPCEPHPPLSAFKKNTTLVTLTQGLKNGLIIDSIFGYFANEKHSPAAVDHLITKINEKQIQRRNHPDDVESQNPSGEIGFLNSIASNLNKSEQDVLRSLKSAFNASPDLFRAAQNAAMSTVKTVGLYFFVSRPNLTELLNKTIAAVDKCQGNTKTEDFEEEAKEIARSARAKATPTGQMVDALAKNFPAFDPDPFRKGPTHVAEDIRQEGGKFDFAHSTKAGFINPSDNIPKNDDQRLLDAMVVALTANGHDWPDDLSSRENIPFLLEVRNEEFDKTRKKLIKELTVDRTLELRKNPDWIDKTKETLFGGRSDKTVRKSVNGVCVWPLFEALTSGQEYRLSKKLLKIVDDAQVCVFHCADKAAEEHANKRFNDKNDVKMKALKRAWVARNLLSYYNDPESAKDAVKVLALCLVASGGADRAADQWIPGGGAKAVAARTAGLAGPDLADNSMGVYPEVKGNLDAQDLPNSGKDIWKALCNKNAPGSLIVRRGFFSAVGGTVFGALASIPASIMNSRQNKLNPLLSQFAGWLPSSIGTASGIPINYALTLPDTRIAYQQNLIDKNYFLPNDVDSLNKKETDKHCQLMAMNEIMARSGMANASTAFNYIPTGVSPPFVAEVAKPSSTSIVQTVQSVYSPMTENILRLLSSYFRGNTIAKAEKDLEMEITTRPANNVAPLNPDALRRYSHNGFMGAGHTLTHMMSWPVRRFFSNDPYEVDLSHLQPAPNPEDSEAVRKLRARSSSQASRASEQSIHDSPGDHAYQDRSYQLQPRKAATLQLPADNRAWATGIPGDKNKARG